jgi:hypothetical protein
VWVVPVVSADAFSIVRYVSVSCIEIDCLQFVHPFLLFGDYQVKLNLKETLEDILQRFSLKSSVFALKSTRNSTQFLVELLGFWNLFIVRYSRN